MRPGFKRGPARVTYGATALLLTSYLLPVAALLRGKGLGAGRGGHRQHLSKGDLNVDSGAWRDAQ